MNAALTFARDGDVTLGGILGAALDANAAGRLSTFIVDETSPAIALFAPEHVRANDTGDWYGEHAGKWLYAASKAAARTRDAALTARVRRVADWLIARQESSGYLGTYPPARRFMQPQPPKPVSWNGEPAVRTWDLWIHSYLVLGFLELHRHFAHPGALGAARRIGDLCHETFVRGGLDVTELGNHHGLSATVLMDPAVELFFATGEARYLELAQRVLAQAERNPQLALLSRALAGADASEIATGKAYQLLWNLVALAKLHRATGEARHLEAAVKLWRNVRDHHLTLGGGPWGGVAHRSREVFNPAAVFSPIGYVETCSTMAWIALNRELLVITGEAAYAEEIERSAYNDLLGAQAPNGEDWCYYSFPNGRRVHTTYWRCCKSSGAMALEDLPACAYALADGAIQVNLLGPSHARLALPGAGAVRLEQATLYPFDGGIRLRVQPERPAAFAIRVRIPAWADGARVRVGAEPAAAAVPGRHLEIQRTWSAGDVVDITLPMTPGVHRRRHRNVQESVAPDGAAIRQEVMSHEYLALTQGPLAFATDLIDGFKTEETLRLPAGPAERWLDSRDAADGEPGAELRLRPEGRAPLTFRPYYRAGGRRDGAWRLTWMSLAPEPA